MATGGLGTGMSPARAGDPLPDLVLPRLGGGEVAFRDLRGGRRVLFFWGSW